MPDIYLLIQGIEPPKAVDIPGLTLRGEDPPSSPVQTIMAPLAAFAEAIQALGGNVSVSAAPAVIRAHSTRKFLTADEKREIAKSSESKSVLAARYGVSSATIYHTKRAAKALKQTETAEENHTPRRHAA